MNFRSIFILVFIKVLLTVKLLKVSSLERMIDPENLKRANGEEIMKILNLDKNISNSTDVEGEESEVLKHRMNKSDINSFEEYLESYLKILRKMNQNEKVKKTSNSIENGLNSTRSEENKNSTSLDRKGRVTEANNKNEGELELEEKKENNSRAKKLEMIEKVKKSKLKIEEKFSKKEILSNEKNITEKTSDDERHPSQSIFKIMNKTKVVSENITRDTYKADSSNYNVTKIAENKTASTDLNIIANATLNNANESVAADYNSTMSIDNFMLSTKSDVNMSIDNEKPVESNDNIYNITQSKSVTASINKTYLNEVIQVEQKHNNKQMREIESNEKRRLVQEPTSVNTSISISNTNNTHQDKFQLIKENKTILNTANQSLIKSSQNETLLASSLVNPSTEGELQVKTNNTINPEKASLLSLNTTSNTTNHGLKAKVYDKAVKIQKKLKENSHDNISVVQVPQPRINNINDHSVYENLRRRNEEFDQIEKSSEKQDKNMGKQQKPSDTEKIEYKVYKRIIEIGVSLIIIGIFMGILLGIIIVTYFNSKK